MNALDQIAAQQDAARAQARLDYPRLLRRLNKPLAGDVEALRKAMDLLSLTVDDVKAHVAAVERADSLTHRAKLTPEAKAALEAKEKEASAACRKWYSDTFRKQLAAAPYFMFDPSGKLHSALFDLSERSGVYDAPEYREARGEMFEAEKAACRAYADARESLKRATEADAELPKKLADVVAAAPLAFPAAD